MPTTHESAFMNNIKSLCLTFMEKNTAMLCLFLFCLIVQAQAQGGQLSGKVVDDKHSPLPFANVALMQPGNKTLVSGAISDSTGNFSLATPVAGKYFLRFSAIGFTEQQSEVFE